MKKILLIALLLPAFALAGTAQTLETRTSRIYAHNVPQHLCALKLGIGDVTAFNMGKPYASTATGGIAVTAGSFFNRVKYLYAGADISIYTGMFEGIDKKHIILQDAIGPVVGGRFPLNRRSAIDVSCAVPLGLAIDFSHNSETDDGSALYFLLSPEVSVEYWFGKYAVGLQNRVMVFPYLANQILFRFCFGF